METSTLNSESPWRGRLVAWLPRLVGLSLWLALFGRYLIAPQGVAPAERDGDFYLFAYPLADVAFEMLGAGIIPHWNPYTDCGVPLLISVQQGVLYPPNVIHLFVDTARAFCLLLAGHTLLAGVGTWLYCRSRGRSELASVIAAMVFVGGGTGLVHFHEGQAMIVYAICWWPWILWQLDRLMSCRTVGGLSGLALLLALQFLAGFPLFTLVMAWLIPLYLLLFAIEWKPGALRDNLCRLTTSASAAVLALAMVTAVLWPAVDFMDQAHRGELSLELAESHRVPLAHWARAVVPGLFGNPVEDTYWGDPQHWNVLFHGGAIGLVLAACGLLVAWQKETCWWAGLSLLLLSYCAGGLVFTVCYLYVPGFSLFRRPMILRLFLLFALSMLSSAGADALWTGRRHRASRGLMAGTMFAGVAGIAYGLAASFGWVSPPGWYVDLIRASVGGGDLIDDVAAQARQFQSMAAQLAIVSGLVVVAGFVLLWTRSDDRPTWQAAVLLGAVAAELFVVGSGWLETSEVATKAEPSQRVAEALAHQRGDYRLACLCDERSKLFNRFAIDRFETPGGAEDLIPRRYSLFLFALTGQPPFLQHVFAFGPDTPRPVKRSFLDLLGVRHYVCPKDAHHRFAVDLAGDRLVQRDVFRYDGVDYDLFENATANERVTIVHRWREVEPLEALESRVASEQELLVALEERLRPLVQDGMIRGTTIETFLPQPDLPEEERAESKHQESVELVERTPHRVTVRVKMAHAGLVVFSDTWTPDWHATLDGSPARVIPANLFMRAVACPGGDHTISLYYRSESFDQGAMVSGLAWVVCLGLLVLGRVRRQMRVRRQIMTRSLAAVTISGLLTAVCATGCHGCQGESGPTGQGATGPALSGSTIGVGGVEGGGSRPLIPPRPLLRVPSEDGGGGFEMLEMAAGDLRVAAWDNTYSPNRLSGLRSLVNVKEAPEYDAFRVALNFEHIISGHNRPENDFSPRHGRYTLRQRRPGEVTWTRRAEDSPWKIDSRMVARLSAPHAIDFEFTCVPRDASVFGEHGYAVLFWANYMNPLTEIDMHFLGISREGGPEEWVSARAPRTDFLHRHGGVYLGRDASPLPFDDDHKSPWNVSSYRYPRFTRPFFYAKAEHGMALILMFDRMKSELDEIRFAMYRFQVKEESKRPAWDFQYVLRKVETDRRYGFSGRLVFKKFISAQDCQAEYEAWRSGRDQSSSSSESAAARTNGTR